MACDRLDAVLQGLFLPIAEEASLIVTQAVTHIDSGLDLVKIDFNFSFDNSPFSFWRR